MVLAVQTIGARHAKLAAPPFILLSADDRAGGGTFGETLRINYDCWDDIRRVAAFAQPPIQLRTGAGSSDLRLCAIALPENDAARLTMTRKVAYLVDQRQLDEHFGWELRWQPGSKPG